MIPTSGKIGICEVCGSEAEMTWDHIVPKWLLQDVARMNIDLSAVIEKAALKGRMWRSVCPACNTAKGGMILWTDPIVRLFIKNLILAIYEKFKLYEGPRKLKVVCGCGRKEPCSTVPGTINTPIPSSLVIPRPEMAHLSPREAHAARS